MEDLIGIIIAICLTILGLVFGSWNEKNHYKKIVKAEEDLADIQVISEKEFERQYPNLNVKEYTLVTGGIAVACDYFKIIFASLQNIFGGNMSSYESLIDRARRAAIVRMKESAREHNATIIVQTRIETSNIGSGRKSPIIEAFSYGTAIITN